MSEDFKIISEGKELSYPLLRILCIVLWGMLFGLATGAMIMRHMIAVQ